MHSGDDEDAGPDGVAAFNPHRELLFGVAYRVLGRAVDAEDVVQDAWLRWRDVDHARIVDVRAYLVKVTTRLAIDRLRSAQRRRETYVGPWLPEPILTGTGHTRAGLPGSDLHATNVAGDGVAGSSLTGGGLTSPDVADEVARAETVSFALLVVLEALSPLERAVFVLREAFALSYAEIGEVLDRTEEAVRQLARRARDHVRERRPRFDTDHATQRRVTEQFLAASMSGDLASLMRVLAPDVTLHGDGGGVAKGPLRVISTADKVGRFLLGMATNAPPEPRAFLATVNGQVALVVTSRGVPHSVLALEVADGRVTTVRLIANPDKLRGLRDIERVGTSIPLG
ncbi:RNA polymerase sigma factor SigJ [Actinopolymorpha sp. B11F2]|uniref:RNA polymerase sigma factor SigJ n=1 Tax=Actinopolymorpha sp. B11F2 TaxID=3160862 RepID=UPI0032E425E0